jgi:Uma2 family endonuclease
MSTTQREMPIMLGPDLAGALLTPEEFDAVEEWDENHRYELIHGVLVVTPIPSVEETGPNEELGRWLLNYREQHPQGSALDYTYPEQYVRTRTGRRRADRLIWVGLGRMPNRHMDLPAIAVEFVSAGKRNWRRDYEEKRREYMEIGLQEYWVFDRFRRILTLYRNQPTGLSEVVVQESETYSTPSLPGFELPLARLLALADAIGQSE